MEEGKEPEVRCVKRAGERKKALDLPVLIFRGSSHLMEGNLLVVARVSFFQVALIGCFLTSGILMQYHEPRRSSYGVAEYHEQEGHHPWTKACKRDLYPAATASRTFLRTSLDLPYSSHRMRLRY